MKKINVLGVQVICNSDVETMLARCEGYVADGAADKNIDLIVFPELFAQSPWAANFGEQVGDKTDLILERMSEMAVKYNAVVVAGSIPQKKGGKIYNTSFVFSKTGEQVGSYSKIHLFDSLGMRESDVVSAGDGPRVFDVGGYKIGLMICYDLRFPELGVSLVNMGADMIVAPAAFFSPRSDHFEMLVRSLALQTSLPVVSCNQFGTLDDGVGFVGRSQIVDPWGVVTAGASDKEGYFYGEVDFNYRDTVHKKLPKAGHRRPDLYKI